MTGISSVGTASLDIDTCSISLDYSRRLVAHALLRAGPQSWVRKSLRGSPQTSVFAHKAEVTVSGLSKNCPPITMKSHFTAVAASASGRRTIAAVAVETTWRGFITFHNTGESFLNKARRTILMGGVPCPRNAS